ncbi:uncharacterized protein BDCG_05539 [Blastomyces dermatitidis ER-3]|uniref:CCHC-type domain-containing protein n=1 Tax=Ajellomyces dermatitidis (strain ER-3 / ATCC MYA-2586) TaxID=559297 RepID=A0ABP2F180_AJEDR|nr:uncharacterized protein BDCG_05539 [Blastomyces dermatitidis ER-3]EEQ90419.2 hypothetical protein BDCG_05539 [Blastomyces dermatitidis ER-3]
MINESNELNNKYEDLVEDAMSDNMSGSSGQSDNTSEETSTDESLISDEKTSANNAQDKEKEKVSENKDKDFTKLNRKGNNAIKTCYHCQKIGHIQTDCWLKFPEKCSTSCDKDKDKDKNVKNMSAAPVHNVMKQVFCIKEKAYASDQIEKDT